VPGLNLWKVGLPVMVILVLVSGVWWVVQGPPTEQARKVAVGEPAPDFHLPGLEGGDVSLSQFRGKVVFLNFWASWCPPCRMEMPSMERLNEVYGGKNFVMLAVNTEGEPDGARRFLQNNPHSFRVLLDSEGKVHTMYGVFKFPETFLIDPEGRIVEHIIGARDWSSVDILKKIRGLVEGKAQ